MAEGTCVQAPVAVLQQAPELGWHGNEVRQEVPAAPEVPPARAQIAGSRSWHPPQQQQGGAALVQRTGNWLHAPPARKLPPAWVHVLAEAWSVHMPEVKMQHAPEAVV